MDLFTRFRTILVMFVLISFVSFLVGRYFYDSVQIKIIEHSPGHSPGHSLGHSPGHSLGHSPGHSLGHSLGHSPEPASISISKVAGVDPVSHWGSALDYFCPFEKEGFGFSSILNNVVNDTPNIPIWSDHDSSANFFKLSHYRPNIVTWGSLKKKAAFYKKKLLVGNMSFSFWIIFDETVKERRPTSIFKISDPTNPFYMPLRVIASKTNPTLEISYMTDKLLKTESQSISSENDLYGGNEIGFKPTFVFITIQNNLIRLVLDGVEQNKFGEDIIFEPGDNFVIGSGGSDPGNMQSYGISFRDFKIYAEHVQTTHAKTIFDKEKQNIYALVKYIKPPSEYKYVGNGGCHNDSTRAGNFCRDNVECDYIGQQSNGCWHLLDSTGTGKGIASYPKNISKITR